jgi:hypothetical protein
MDMHPGGVILNVTGTGMTSITNEKVIPHIFIPI